MNAVVLIANSDDDTIATLALDDGRLRPLATTPLPGSSSTFAVDAARRLVYAGVKSGFEPDAARGEGSPAILTLVLGADGVLSELARTPWADPMVYLALTPDGRTLLGASYHGGSGVVWPAEDGVLRAPTAELRFPNVHSVALSPDGAHAYYVSLGDDLIAQYALSAGGILSPLDPLAAPAPAGSGPRHLVLSADGRSAYLVTEFSGEVIRFDRDQAGRLTPAESVSIVDPDAGLRHSRYGADPRAEHLIWGADVHLAAGGRYLLASERTANTIATIELDAHGRLGPVVALRRTEPQPRGFGVSPDGEWVVAVGELSDSAALYRVETDGRLTDADRVPTGRGANWVRFA